MEFTEYEQTVGKLAADHREESLREIIVADNCWDSAMGANDADMSKLHIKEASYHNSIAQVHATLAVSYSTELAGLLALRGKESNVTTR